MLNFETNIFINQTVFIIFTTVYNEKKKIIIVYFKSDMGELTSDA